MANPKILIVYASAGHGHEKAAKAVLESYESLAGKGLARTIDTLKLAPGACGEIYKQIYLLQIKYTPWLWGAFYYSLDFLPVYFVMKYVRRLFNALTMGALEKILLTENPDMIIATHFTVAEVANRLKEKKLITSNLCVIVTDYYPHYIWTAPLVDHYIVAAEETKQSLIQRGVRAGIIEVLGIPIERKFSETLDRAALCGKNNVRPDDFTILVTSGGGGIGAMQDVVLQILKLGRNIQVLAVCGTNKALFDGLKKQEPQYPGLKTFAFVNNMNELMRMADVVVGKAGGLTITESFSMGKPVALFGSVPGQEARNVFFVKKYGLGYSVDHLSDLVEIVSKLTGSPDEMNRLTANVSAVAKPNASADISRFILRVAKPS